MKTYDGAVCSKVNGEYGFIFEREVIIKPVFKLFNINPLFLPGGMITTQTDFYSELKQALFALALIDNNAPGITDYLKKEAHQALRFEIPLWVFIRSPISGSPSEKIATEIEREFGKSALDNDLVFFRNSQELLCKLIIHIIRFFQQKGITLRDPPDLRHYSKEYPYVVHTEMARDAQQWFITNHKTSLFRTGSLLWSRQQPLAIEQTVRLIKQRYKNFTFVHIYDINATHQELSEQAFIKYEKGSADGIMRLINFPAASSGVLMGIRRDERPKGRGIYPEGINMKNGQRGTLFGGVPHNCFTIPFVAADGSLLLILNDECTKYTCSFYNVPFDFCIDSLLLLPGINPIISAADINNLHEVA